MVWVWKHSTRLPQVLVLFAFVIFAALSSTMAVQAQYESPQSASGLISLDVVDADLSKVVLMLARESKQSIIIADQEKMHNKVTATLREVPLETALKYVVESVGCAWSRTQDGVYIIGGKPQAAAPQATVPLVESISSTGYGKTYEARRETKVDTLKLYNMGAVDMMWTLGLYQLQDTEKVQNAQYKPAVNLRHLKGEVETVPMPDQSTPPLTESLKGNPAYAERAPELGNEAAQVYAPPAPPGYTGARQPGTTVRTGQTNIPGAPGGTGTPGAGSLVPDGIDTVMPYEVDNSLIVRGDAEAIEELKAIISKLDIAPKQIMIKAEFVNIGINDESQLGIDWSLERLNTTFSANLGSTGNVRFGYANGNVIATLQAMLRADKAKVVNAPLISTLNNVPAWITIEKQIPNWIPQTVYTSNGVANTLYYPQPLNVQTSLSVTPRINNADNSITVFILPQLSHQGKEKNSPDGKTSLPEITQERLQTSRRVANGETIVIGGMIEKSSTNTVNKIPLLGDIPLIGPLFRSTSELIIDSETLIFLTPTIIPERPIAGTGIGVIP